MTATSLQKPLILKYRPTRLKDLVGQAPATSILKGISRSGRVSGTYLIHGPYGCGKTTTARILILRLNCQNPDKNGDPCGACASCVAAENNLSDHPDVQEMNAAKERGIDDMRRMVEVASFSPTFNYRFFLLDEAHMVTGPAFQSLLKVLEEPPPRTRFLLVTSDPDKVPGTIKSRCQTIQIKRLDPELLAEELLYPVCKKERVKVPRKILLQIAKNVNGRPRDALSVLEQVFLLCAGENLSNKDIATRLPEIIDSTVVEDPQQVAKNWLLHCAKNKAAAFTVWKNVERYDYLLSLCVEYIAEVHSSQGSGILGKALSKCHTMTLAEAAEALARAMSIAYSSDTNMRATMYALTLRLIGLFEE